MEEELKQLAPTMKEIFHHLHTHPEVSWEEYETTKYIKKKLEQFGFAPKLLPDTPGLVVEIGEGPTTVALRADIDALWQEVNGVFQANHSCGHDAHMTMAVGVLLLLKKINYRPNGKIKVLFQPAEEKGTGALKMIDLGLLDDVDYLYGVHLRPIEELPFGKAAPAIIHGAAKFITGEIIGEEAHGARPHLGTNAIEIGATLVNELSKIHVDPMVPATAKLTKFHAGGSATNLIPGSASFHIDVRAQTNGVMDTLTKRIYEISEAVATLHGATIDLETKVSIAAAEVNEEAQGLMEQAIIESLGKKQTTGPIITSGGEDFHFYTLKKPQIKATMLGLGCDLQPGLHHPDMTFNRDAILIGIQILTKVIMYTFKHIEGAHCREK